LIKEEWVVFDIKVGVQPDFSGQRRRPLGIAGNNFLGKRLWTEGNSRLLSPADYWNNRWYPAWAGAPGQMRTPSSYVRGGWTRVL